MRLSSDAIKEGMLHVDPRVRNESVHYFADSFTADPDVMPLAIQAIERHGWHEAFQTYNFMRNLPQTEATVAWLVGRIEDVGSSETADGGEWLEPIIEALLGAPPELLRAQAPRITGLAALCADDRAALADRLAFAELPAEELANRLHATALALGDAKDFDGERRRGTQLVQALARHPDFATAWLLDHFQKLEAAKVIDDDDWFPMFLAELAGALRLEQALPFLIDFLYGPDDSIFAAASDALVRIGTASVVESVLSACRDEPDVSMALPFVLQRVHLDLSVQAALDAYAQADPEHVAFRSELLQAALLNFATLAIEPARQFVLETPLDPDVVLVREDLLILCKLAGHTFPEFEAWSELAEHDAEFRRRWYEEHGFGSWDDEDIDDEDIDDEDFVDEDFVDGFVDDGFVDEDFSDEPGRGHVLEPLTPSTYVRDEERVGRNDPCPCGSGKKFKKCCMNKAKKII